MSRKIVHVYNLCIDVAFGTDDDIMVRLKKMLVPASKENIDVFL